MNIVFDLGGVVFRWQPENIIRQFFDDSGQQDIVRSEIFSHPDWLELDRGTIEMDRAIIRGAARTGLPRHKIAELLNAVPHFLTPIEETIDLVRAVHGSNNRLFVLSNMHRASASHLEERHNIWDLFDGVVFSSRVQMIKPEIEIYEHLLSRYGLVAAETVFIDDVSENLATASTLGIQTLLFENANSCKQDLENLGCL
jgi:putative hydrolase of the HAD superfamily